MELKPFNIIFNVDWAWVDLTVNRNIGSDTTLLTIGDSWTWGDEIGRSNGLRGEENSDSEYRVSKCFGNLLANQLNANWVQMALPGGSNEWITCEFEKLIPQLVPQTKNIIAVIGFSDQCRDMNLEKPILIDYYKQALAAGVPIVEIIRHVESTYYSRIDRVLEKYPTVKCIANSAFTTPMINHHTQTPDVWCNLLFDQPIAPAYISTSGIFELTKFLDDHKLLTDAYRREVTDVLYPMVLHRVDIMESSPLFFKRCHPREKGHEIWANYLYNYIKNSL